MDGGDMAVPSSPKQDQQHTGFQFDLKTSGALSESPPSRPPGENVKTPPGRF
ncbi:hypothetical protein PGT21_007135 [Puccinia graminis f. sp. tritici]|uniref:Uncharacterized protein n=1 Tax=Puccinia graminis f. sp. tritici TaxID=56615 RepID=A0A5B0NYM9_PUCGR|nr:hypothetical protein PGT21_007135 [Puccinia graminis f. sp. tritici]KAA1093654.1 hypothetical protein PGTUg99_016991 [Puccinia graminis f. sp. tritici]